VGPLVEGNILLILATKAQMIFQTISVCGRYECQKKLHIAFNAVTDSKIEIAAVREGLYSNWIHVLCLEKRDLNSGVCSAQKLY
jgi:hypothetical protein